MQKRGGTMQKKQRKIGIWCALAAFCLSALGTVLPKTVGADENTVSTAALIGTKTSNVTVTPSAYAGAYTGLKISPSSATDEWRAQLDTVFTDQAVLTYLLPDKTEAKELPDGDYKHQGNAFSVQNSLGETVATYVIFHEHSSLLQHSSAYFYNAVNDTYWTPIHHWEKANQVDYWATPTARERLYPDKSDGRCIGYPSGHAKHGTRSYIESLSGQYIAPKFGATDEEYLNSSTGYLKADGVLEGQLSFLYDAKTETLKITTSTFDMSKRTFEDTGNAAVTGNGQTITVGEVQTDLSGGFTIVMHNAPDFGKTGDVNYWEHTHSSSVLLTSVNGFSALAPTVSVLESSQNISYPDEEIQNGNNVIRLYHKQSLSSFAYRTARTVCNTTGGVSLQLLGGYEPVLFDYADNKPFTANETITVSYNGLQKTYTVYVMNVIESLQGVQMRAGAQVRTEAPYTLKFTMTFTQADIDLIDAHVGAGKYYTSVKIGMFTIPYAYLSEYGEITQETLFGANATYTWQGKTATGTETATIDHRVLGADESLYQGRANAFEDPALWYMNFGKSHLTTEEMTTLYFGVGYVELTTRTGEKEYKIVSRYQGYVENADNLTNAQNNVRSAYNVAKTTYEDGALDSISGMPAIKQWILQHYLLPCGYNN